MNIDRLPVEVWARVVELSRRDVQRTLLFVNHAFHDLAVPHVFRDVAVRIAIDCPPVEKYQPTVAECAVATPLEKRAQEFLEYIASDPLAIRAVRDMTVEWHFLSKDKTDERQIQKFCDLIAVAIMKLPKLLSFRCSCIDDEEELMTQHLVNTLVWASRMRKLQVLSVPLFQLQTPSISKLHNMKALSFNMDLEDNEYWDSRRRVACADIMAHTIAANAASLEKLLASGHPGWTCALPALRDLSIIDMKRVHPLTTLHRLWEPSLHLTSLTITGTDALQDVFAAFRAAPDALPNLTAFKFICDYKMGYSATVDREAVAMFIESKKLLRRLHLMMPIEHREVQADHRPILAVLPQLPHLEVLGVELNSRPITDEDLAFIDEHLPQGLTDLLVYTRFDCTVFPDEAFLSLFTARTTLKTLSLLDWNCSGVTEPRVAVPYLLDHAPPALEHVAFDTSLWPVCRCAGVEPPNPCERGASSLCPCERAALPGPTPFPEECGLENWVWLHKLDQRHHTLHDVAVSIRKVHRERGASDEFSGPLRNYVDLRRIEGVGHVHETLHQ